MYNIGYITLIGGIATTAPHLVQVCYTLISYTSQILFCGAFFETPNKQLMKPKRDILAYLQSGGRLTVNKALRLFHTTELRKIVSRLRKEGWTICADKRQDETEDGRKVTYNEYYLVR